MMQTILDIVNDSEILPVTARLDYLSRTGDVSASVAGHPGTDTPYINAGGRVEQPFAIYLRAPEKRTGSDLDARATLKSLAAHMNAQGVSGLKVEPTPYVTGRDASDSVYWRVDGVVRWTRPTESEE